MLYPLLNGDGPNWIERLTIRIESFGDDIFALLDTVLDNFVPILVIAIVLILLYESIQQLRAGATWRDIASWLWGKRVVPVFIILVAAAIIFGIEGVFPGIRNDIEVALKNFFN